MKPLAALRRRSRRFARTENGNGTIEFCLFLPLFLVLFISSFDLGMVLARNTMLDRGLDMTIRMVRLGQITNLTHDRMKTAICQASVIIPDCENNLRLEMQPLDPRNWVNIPTDSVNCVDRADDSRPVRTFVAGLPNQLMIVRACALIDPIAPTAGLGAILTEQYENGFPIISTAAYVVEP